jgi:hypothetical protein
MELKMKAEDRIDAVEFWEFKAVCEEIFKDLRSNAVV